MFSISTLKSLSDKERHEYILNSFILNNKSISDQRKHKRDIDVIREHHRFLWDDGTGNSEDSWEVRLAKRYYDKLFKEYCIAELARHKENKIALRWRTEAEVIAGIGQFQCGSRKCLGNEGLRTWEVNFVYKEQGDQRNALVKVRLCSEHSAQLNYTSKKREIKRLKHAERQKAKSDKYTNKKLAKFKKKYQDISNEQEEDIQDEAEVAKSSNSKGNEEHDANADENFETEADDVWNKKADVEMGPVSREAEFELYLEELLF